MNLNNYFNCECRVHENHQTCWTFLMARPKCLMRDFTNLNRIYKAHRTNVWWTMKVFRLHCEWYICSPVSSNIILLLFTADSKDKNKPQFLIQIQRYVLCGRQRHSTMVAYKLAVNRDIDFYQMHFEKTGNQDSLWYTSWYFTQIKDKYSDGLSFNNANQRWN